MGAVPVQMWAQSRRTMSPSPGADVAQSRSESVRGLNPGATQVVFWYLGAYKRWWVLPVVEFDGSMCAT